MRFGVLVHHFWRDYERVRVYVHRCAQRFPDAIMLSAGVGLGPYTAERAALRAGLRVAAFRVVPRQPESPAGTRRFPADDARPYVLPLRDVVVYELEPGNQEHLDRLWTPDGYSAATERTDAEAVAKAIFLVGRESEHVVCFSDFAWPDLEGVHRIGAVA